ncbi:unnamed protein product [Amoebophrya sp. A120]|nr:unnamed protein product [Amoebophrya sp. A120]|eukprot:GSA120T00025566001.1
MGGGGKYYFSKKSQIYEHYCYVSPRDVKFALNWNEKQDEGKGNQSRDERKSRGTGDQTGGSSAAAGAKNKNSSTNSTSTSSCARVEQWFEGYFVVYKPSMWICDNENADDIRKEGTSGHKPKNIVTWLIANYGKAYPFLCHNFNVFTNSSFSSCTESEKEWEQRLLFQDHSAKSDNSGRNSSRRSGAGTAFAATDRTITTTTGRTTSVDNKDKELEEALQQIRTKSQFGLLHRLDRETSGCILVAYTREAFVQLQTTKRQKMWHKEYETLVHGTIPPRLWRDQIAIPLKKRARAAMWEATKSPNRYVTAHKAQQASNRNSNRFFSAGVKFVVQKCECCSESLRNFKRENGLTDYQLDGVTFPGCKYNRRPERVRQKHMLELKKTFALTDEQNDQYESRAFLQECTWAENQKYDWECLEHDNTMSTLTYEVIGYYKYFSKKDKREFPMTRLRVKLQTGRTHQIRAQLKFLLEDLAADDNAGKFAMSWKKQFLNKVKSEEKGNSNSGASSAGGVVKKLNAEVVHQKADEKNNPEDESSSPSDDRKNIFSMSPSYPVCGIVGDFCYTHGIYKFDESRAKDKHDRNDALFWQNQAKETFTSAEQLSEYESWQKDAWLSEYNYEVRKKQEKTLEQIDSELFGEDNNNRRRVFLHTGVLGWPTPESNNVEVQCVKTELPVELQNVFSKLTVDEELQNQLKKWKEEMTGVNVRSARSSKQNEKTAKPPTEYLSTEGLTTHQRMKKWLYEFGLNRKTEIALNSFYRSKDEKKMDDFIREWHAFCPMVKVETRKMDGAKSVKLKSAAVRGFEPWKEDIAAKSSTTSSPSGSASSRRRGQEVVEGDEEQHDRAGRGRRSSEKQDESRTRTQGRADNLTPRTAHRPPQRDNSSRNRTGAGGVTSSTRAARRGKMNNTNKNSATTPRTESEYAIIETRKDHSLMVDRILTRWMAAQAIEAELWMKGRVKTAAELKEINEDFWKHQILKCSDDVDLVLSTGGGNKNNNNNFRSECSKSSSSSSSAASSSDEHENEVGGKKPATIPIPIFTPKNNNAEGKNDIGVVDAKVSKKLPKNCCQFPFEEEEDTNRRRKSLDFTMGMFLSTEFKETKYVVGSADYAARLHGGLPDNWYLVFDNKKPIVEDMWYYYNPITQDKRPLDEHPAGGGEVEENEKSSSEQAPVVAPAAAPQEVHQFCPEQQLKSKTSIRETRTTTQDAEDAPGRSVADTTARTKPAPLLSDADLARRTWICEYVKQLDHSALLEWKLKYMKIVRREELLIRQSKVASSVHQAAAAVAAAYGKESRENFTTNKTIPVVLTRPATATTAASGTTTSGGNKTSRSGSASSSSSSSGTFSSSSSSALSSAAPASMINTRATTSQVPHSQRPSTQQEHQAVVYSKAASVLLSREQAAAKNAAPPGNSSTATSAFSSVILKPPPTKRRKVEPSGDDGAGGKKIIIAKNKNTTTTRTDSVKTNGSSIAATRSRTSKLLSTCSSMTDFFQKSHARMMSRGIMSRQNSVEAPAKNSDADGQELEGVQVVAPPPSALVLSRAPAAVDDRNSSVSENKTADGVPAFAPAGAGASQADSSQQQPIPPVRMKKRRRSSSFPAENVGRHDLNQQGERNEEHRSFDINRAAATEAVQLPPGINVLHKSSASGKENTTLLEQQQHYARQTQSVADHAAKNQEQQLTAHQKFTSVQHAQASSSISSSSSGEQAVGASNTVLAAPTSSTSFIPARRITTTDQDEDKLVPFQEKFQVKASVLSRRQALINRHREKKLWAEAGERQVVEHWSAAYQADVDDPRYRSFSRNDKKDKETSQSASGQQQSTRGSFTFGSLAGLRRAEVVSEPVPNPTRSTSTGTAAASSSTTNGMLHTGVAAVGAVDTTTENIIINNKHHNNTTAVRSNIEDRKDYNDVDHIGDKKAEKERKKLKRRSRSGSAVIDKKLLYDTVFGISITSDEHNFDQEQPGVDFRDKDIRRGKVDKDVELHKHAALMDHTRKRDVAGTTSTRERRARTTSKDKIMKYDITKVSTRSTLKSSEKKEKKALYELASTSTRGTHKRGRTQR